MDILIAVAAKIAEYTVAPIGRQVGYLIFYKAKFKELRDRVSDLEYKRDEIKQRVEEERRNGKTTSDVVQNWLKNVDDAIGDVTQLQNDPRHAKAGCSRWSFPNVVTRHQLSRKATKVAKKVVEVREGGDFSQVAYCPKLDAMSAFTTRSSQNLESRKPIMENIMHALRDPKVTMVGVYGLGGVGKTTLIEEVYQIAKKNQLFDEVVMATISKTPDIKTVQEEIADQLGLHFEEVTVAGRAPRLCQRIQMEKTILLILDNIWETLDLKKIGIPSEGEHNGCKILMTSRNLDLLRQMGVKENFRLEVLNEEESWNLFKAMAGNVDEEFSLHQIALQLAKKCAGLPVLIVTMARSLINQDIHAWKDALNQLKKVDNEELQEITYSALELSYKRLKGNEMKALFLLCATVAENPSVSDLFYYGMGLGIFNNTDTLEGAKDRLHIMISALKASCLLTEDDTHTKVKMHDVVREVAISIASRDHHMLIKHYGELKEWPTIDFLRRCSQIILHRCQIHTIPEKVDCPKLSIFQLESKDRSLDIPDCFFKGMKSLKVLDLTRLNLASLPTSIRLLTRLTTLCLYNCVLENIDAIGALKSLEILIICHSSMIKLPVEIGELNNLRMLNLSDSGIEVIPPNIISSLIRLEELYMGNTSIKWEIMNSDNEGENASLDELRQLPQLRALELQVQEACMLPRDLMFDNLESYKIVIGDIWEWSAIKNVSVKTLNLKLGTNIHLEHSIKGLIKRSEILYLDEVEGISNVLFQLNGDGFQQLKYFHIQNNAIIKHIVDLKERTHVPIPFPNLENLVIQNLSKMEKICHGPLAVGSFAKLQTVKVENCNKVKYLFSVSMVKRMSQLSELQVSQCDLMEMVVFGDGDASAMNDETNEPIEFASLHSLTLQHLHALASFFSHEPTSSHVSLFNNQVAFFNLDTLKLSSLKLNKIWKDNQHSFYKLTNLIVENCDGLKYLFSSTMVESFPNLTKLEISECHLMEEIIAAEEDSDNNIVTLEEVRFFKLQTIILKNMKSLKKIWHKEFSKVKTLQVKNCEKIRAIFSSSMQKAYNDLETLMVTDCVSVEEIFQLSSDENYSTEQTQLKKITLERLSKLKQIWSKDPERALNFCNLEEINVESCINLEFVFPCSVATSCSHLKELTIKWCQNMKEIIAFKEESMFSSISFEFNHLNTLVLWDLLKLKGFYARNYTLSCPSLRKLHVSECVKLNLYRSLSTSSHQKLSDEEYIISTQQHLVAEQVMPNLEDLRIDEKDAVNIFLKRLNVEWSSFKKIFQDKRLTNEKNCTKLQGLTLYQLPNLQHICEEGLQIDPVLELLEILYVDGCSSLINIVPSSVTFCHLSYLEVANCNSMINLLSPHTTRSLAKLTVMKVKQCDSLEEILSKEGEEITNDIVFFSLETLELDSLPRLGRFCSQKCFLRFPLLRKVVVRECARMKYFSEGDRVSTPKLRKVLTAEKSKEFYWKGDLNGTIKHMFENKISFRRFSHLALSDYPELRDFWYDKEYHNLFNNLKSLVVQKCEFLSDVLFTSNTLQVLHGLEELAVRNCDSLITLFDVKEMKSNGAMVKQASKLKKLSLSSLPKLRHIWNADSHQIVSFENLCTVDVVECKSLLYLFPPSICLDLPYIEKLNIVSCGVENIVSMEKESTEINFSFPHLSFLRFIRLEKLKSFYLGRFTLECPSLKTLNVYRCEALQMFTFNHSSLQQDHQIEEINDSPPIPQALFSIEKLSGNSLEELALNGKDAMMMINGHMKEAKFSKVEILRMQCLHDTQLICWNDLLEIFPNVVTLQVRQSSMQILFPIEETTHCSTRIAQQVRKLWLYEMEHLEHIWHEEFLSDQLAPQNLESLKVAACPNMVSVVSYSVSFQSLKVLVVENCKGMTHLITSSVAKSLMQLEKLIVRNCEMIKDVVNVDEEEAEEDIIFENLEYLELSTLISLRSFCYGKHALIFPSLIWFIVKACPQMEVFSPGSIIAPFLRTVEVENKRKRWKGDLNTTIEQLFKENQIKMEN
ncbi:uncharacterized protein LOC130963123 [Arachis stenosperma]|uniref:uncharacterized protein LOC130963123 n=1 Tax=Arachis stenosperma TaxID=217475 RepID=UPI0025AD95A3|nr:uncharacterized protein LOC130963123 [Arachis stenosperma]